MWLAVMCDYLGHQLSSLQSSFWPQYSGLLYVHSVFSLTGVAQNLRRSWKSQSLGLACFYCAKSKRLNMCAFFPHFAQRVLTIICSLLENPNRHRESMEIEVLLEWTEYKRVYSVSLDSAIKPITFNSLHVYRKLIFLTQMLNSYMRVE